MEHIDHMDTSRDAAPPASDAGNTQATNTTAPAHAIVNTMATPAAGPSAAPSELPQLLEQLAAQRADFDKLVATMSDFMASLPSRIVQPGTIRTHGEEQGRDLGIGHAVTVVDNTFGMRYKTPLATDTVFPISLTDCRLGDNTVQIMIKATGDPPPWDENVDKPHYAVEWFESVLLYAQLANLDISAVLMPRLSADGRQWLRLLLPSKTYQQWASDGHALLIRAFRSRFAGEVRADATLALEHWVNKGVQQGEQKLEVYTEQFQLLLRRLSPGTVSPTMQCAVFIKGLHPALFPKCKFTPQGTEWTDLDDLIAHCIIQAFLLKATSTPLIEGGSLQLNSLQPTGPPASRKRAGHHGLGSASKRAN